VTPLVINPRTAAVVEARRIAATGPRALAPGETAPPRLGVLFTYNISRDLNERLTAEATRRNIPIVMDSGAWSVFNAGATIDRVEHARWVKEMTTRYPDVRYLGLDVIGDEEASFRNWVAQRELDARVEPTIHFGAPASDVKRYLAEGLAAMPDGKKWINVGGLVAGQGNPKMHRQMAAWSASILRELPDDVFVHGLGTTTPAVNDLVRFDGVDSSYWLVSLVRFRMLPLFDPSRRKWVRMLLADRKPEYERDSRQDLHIASRILRAFYDTTPAEVWDGDDTFRLNLSLRSHAYFADAYRARHLSPRTPIVYLAGKPVTVTDPNWEDIEFWSHEGPHAARVLPPGGTVSS
jgi:hypothetical protein